MQSKNALGNLINRYKAVLKKCNLINIFGTLAMASALALGGLGVLAMPMQAQAISPTRGNSAYTMTDITGTTPEAGKYFTTFSTVENGVNKTYGVAFDASNTSVAHPYTSIKSVPGTPAVGGYTFRILDSSTATPDDYLYFTVENSGTPITTTNNRIQSNVYNPPPADISENFIGNASTNLQGGAIEHDASGTDPHNPEEDASIDTIIGDFIGNSVESRNGGAIDTTAGTIGMVIGNFIGNSAIDKDGGPIDGSGGAINSSKHHSEDGSIGRIEGDFIGNFASADGGAIYNEQSITTIIGDFINNSSGGEGGAIYTDESIGTIMSNFIGNSAANNGGAIWTFEDLKFVADGRVNIFTGNTAGSSSNAIYVQGAQDLTFQMKGSGGLGSVVGGFIMDDAISGNTTYTVAISGDSTANTFNLNNSIGGTVTLQNATLHFGSVTQRGNLYNGNVYNLSTSGTSIISGDAVINGTANISGTTTFANTATFTNGSTANFNQAITFDNITNRTPTFQTGSTANFNENVTFDEAITFSGASSFDKVSTFNNATTFANTATFTNGSTANFNQAITFDNITNRTPTFQTGSTANFNEDVTFDEAVTLDDATFASGKTASFNSVSNFNGTTTFKGITTLGVVNNSGDIIADGATFTNEYTVGGGLTAKNAVIFEAGYDAAGTLTIDSGTTTAMGIVNIGNGEGLSVTSGTLDVTSGTLKVDSNAATFETGISGTLKVNGDDFGEFFADGTYTLNAAIGKKLDNDGSLHLVGVNLGTIEEEAYRLLLAAVDTDTSDGTVKFGNTTVNTIFSLDSIPDGSELDTRVKAGTLASPKHVKISHLIAADGGITASTINTGAKLTLTGNQSTTLSAGSITNAGELILGTSISEQDRGTIQGDLITSGTTTAHSALDITGKLESTGGTSTFDKAVTADALTLTGGSTSFNDSVNIMTTSTLNGTNTFNGISTFAGAVSSSGATTFNSTASFNAGLEVAGGTTTLKDSITGITTVSGGALVVDAADKTVTTGNINLTTGGLNITAGTLDVSGANLSVANGTTFSTGANGELIAKAANFGTIAQNGTYTYNGSVRQKLDNSGNLVLKNLGFTEMQYADYNSFLTSFKADAVTGNGTFELYGVSIDTRATYLEDIQNGTSLPNNVVLGNNTANPDGGTFANGKTAKLGGVDGDMNNLGTLTLTGAGDANNVLVQGNAENSGTLNLENGSITGSLTNSGTITINGATLVNGSATLGGNVHVQSGSFTAMGDTTLGGGTVRTTGSSGNDISQASAIFLHNLNNGIDGHIITEQGSYTVLGVSDRTYAERAFSESNRSWGTDISAALFITAPQKLDSTGSIHVDGSNINIAAADANSAKFAANSILVVDAKGLNGDVALTSSTSGKLTVASSAKLYITGATSGSTVHIVKGFTDAGSTIATGAWEGDNLTASSSLQVAKVADFDAATGSYAVEITGNSSEGIRKNYHMAQEPTIDLMTNLGLVADVNSSQESIRFFSTLADSVKGIGTNNPRQTVQVWESALQMATSGATAFMGMGASYGAANIILAHLSQSGLGLGSTGGQAPAVVQVNENASGLNGGSDMAGDAIKNGLALWLSPMYKYSTVQGVEAGAFKHGYDTSMGGLALGADYTVNNAFRFGLAFNLGTGYAQSTGDLSQTQNNFDFWGLSLYGAYYKNNFSLMADVGFTSVFGEMSQDVPSILGSSSLEASTQSTIWTAGLTAEYTFETDFMNITPHAGLRYMYVYTGAYDTENNRGTIAQTESDSQGVWYFPVGVTFSKDLVFESGWTFTPKLDVGFIATAGDLHATSVSSIPGVAGNAEYTMQNVDGFAFNGGLGFDLAHKDNGVSVGLNYTVQASEHETGHMLNATFRYEF